MGRENVALYTLDTRYAEAFVNFSLRSEKEKIIVKTFTNNESLEYAVGNNQVDLLLVDGMLMDERIEKLACNKVILSRKKYISKQEENPAIFMYQRAEVVFKQIYDLLADKIVEEKFCCAAIDSMPEFIGVFSPCYPLEREQFAREAAEYLAVNEKVLFVNLAELTEYDSGDEKGISELLLFIQQEGRSMMYKLPAMVRQVDGYDCLGGVRHYQDLRDISEEDIERFIRQFETIDAYSKVILDIGVMGPVAQCLTGCCTKVWMPVNQKMGIGRQNHLKHDMSIEGQGRLMERVTEIEIPEGWYQRKDIRKKWVKQLMSMD